MTPEEHRQYCLSLSDASLREVLSHGPEGYADAAAWAAIEAEAAKRNIRLRTGAPPLSPGAEPPARPLDVESHASLYSVLVHPEGREVAVKDGFCWPAFFFPIIWAAIQGLWLPAAGLALLTLLLGGVTAALDTVAPAFLGGLTVRMLAGRVGNALHRRRLQRQGFALVGQVWASGPDDALAVWVASASGPPCGPTATATQPAAVSHWTPDPC